MKITNIVIPNKDEYLEYDHHKFWRFLDKDKKNFFQELNWLVNQNGRWVNVNPDISSKLESVYQKTKRENKLNRILK
jgi:hypothetical protein